MGVTDKNVDDMSEIVQRFIGECGEMAEKNWTPSQVQQLKWLFGAVLNHEDYADYAEKMMQEEEE